MRHWLEPLKKNDTVGRQLQRVTKVLGTIHNCSVFGGSRRNAKRVSVTELVLSKLGYFFPTRPLSLLDGPVLCQMAYLCSFSRWALGNKYQ